MRNSISKTVSTALALAIGAAHLPIIAQDDVTDTVRPAPGTPTIIAIFAHPDDEIIIAPVLARAARDGADVKLVFASSGNAGPGVSGLEPGEELAELRESEARCSAFALGLPEPIFWRLDDGKLSDRPRDAGSPAEQALGRTVEILTEENPMVVMTWGPDGGYGHGDHRMISSVVTQVVQSMEGRRPDLLYSAIPAGQRPDVPQFDGWATTAPELVTDRLEYQPQDLASTQLAVDCYESQFPAEARAVLPQLLHTQMWRGSVHFRLAFAPLR